MSIARESVKFIAFLTLLFSISVFSQEHHNNHSEDGSEEAFDPTEVIMHHISDSHDFHIAGNLSLPLPVILWTDNGLVTFMSSEFHHDEAGEVVVDKKGMKFVRYHDEIYYAGANGALDFDAEHHPANDRPLNFSITKNVFTLFLAAALMLLIFIPVARSYKKHQGAPRGLAGFMEPLILFVRNEIAIPNIGKKKYERYMPYLLTVFFLIWLGNLFGLIPFFPFSGTLTNDIVFTGVLAVITFLITTFSGNKQYWGHIFATPGVPKPLLLIMIPVEVLGMFTKPFALMVRLFANITAGHIVILSLFSLIFIFKTAAVAPVSIAFALFMFVLELLVAALQAYVFTLLSALFIGQAVEDHH
ncbi:F-type H+-transporting ATPase subunit a [Sinomicrobium oceani]|uniref:ATP synthase subunit a n=1 Tax=Sinomicrobium oceani TaxID=1150368 RepID=A0A1K1P7G4_9FLAO|nr:F0F1 ATP synthase subunit A [Sinomicrobium oceani]SFW43516.1 F-type H+-transporting ATPase subunit a [Sinomicrobium oceani]